MRWRNPAASWFHTQIVQEHAHRRHPEAFGQAQFFVDPLRIERVGLPHLELVDGGRGNVVAADQPGLLGVPRCGLGFGPAAAGGRWRRCLSGGTCLHASRITNTNIFFIQVPEKKERRWCRVRYTLQHHARASRRLSDRYQGRASDCHGPASSGELRFCRAIYGIGAASCILRGAAGTSVHFAGTSLVVGSSHHMQSNILPTRRALAAISLALCASLGGVAPC